MSYTQKLRNTVNTFAEKARQRVVRLFWGTHNDKYIVTQDNKKILFFQDGAFTIKGRDTNSYTNKLRNAGEFTVKERNTNVYTNKPRNV